MLQRQKKRPSNLRKDLSLKDGETFSAAWNDSSKTVLKHSSDVKPPDWKVNLPGRSGRPSQQACGNRCCILGAV